MLQYQVISHVFWRHKSPYHLTPIVMTITKTKKNFIKPENKCWQGHREVGTLLNNWDLPWWSHYAKQYEVLQTTKNRVTQMIKTPNHDPKELFAPLGSLQLIVKTWEILKWTSTGECMKKLWHVYTQWNTTIL